MSTYLTMVQRIESELRRTKIRSEIQQSIKDAIKQLEIHHFWFNEGRATASTIAGNPYMSVPTNFLKPISMKYTDTGYFPLDPDTYKNMDKYDWGTDVTGR